ncbi:hypothetical protein Btru_060887 [Bulinus truncatus]|nr:hypothetical protein Btru_060887 [Bulinus truncatus]
MVPCLAFFLDAADDEEDCDEVEMNFYEWIESSPYNGIILGVTLSTLIFTVFLSLFLRFQNVSECQPQQSTNGPGDNSLSCVGKTCRSSQTLDTARKTAPAICLNKVCTGPDKATVTGIAGEGPTASLQSGSAQGQDAKEKRRTCDKICQKIAGSYKNLMPQCKMCPRSAKKCFNFDDSQPESEFEPRSSPLAKEGYPSATTGSSVDSLTVSQKSPPSPPRVRRGSTMPIAVQTSNAFIDRGATGYKSGGGGGGGGSLKPDDGCVWKIILPKDDSFRVNITCTKLDTSCVASPAQKSVDATASKSPLPNDATHAQTEDCGCKMLKSKGQSKEIGECIRGEVGISGDCISGECISGECISGECISETSVNCTV